jgi:hypothetical protein
VGTGAAVTAEDFTEAVDTAEVDSTEEGDTAEGSTEATAGIMAGAAITEEADIITVEVITAGDTMEAGTCRITTITTTVRLITAIRTLPISTQGTYLASGLEAWAGGTGIMDITGIMDPAATTDLTGITGKPVPPSSRCLTI